MTRHIGFVLLLATAVLIGRFSGQVWLVTISPHGSPMAFGTVMGFLLAVSNAEGTYYRYLKLWLLQKNA